MLFHELGIITPLLIFLYRSVFLKSVRLPKLFWFPIPLYLIARYVAQSHWLSGDYSYNFFKLPFNAVGNAFGYFALTLLGPIAMPLNIALRNGLKAHIVASLIIMVFLVLIINLIYKNYYRKLNKEDRRIMLFGFFFFVISLLPFLGLGNISSRYSYLSSIGIVFMLIIVGKQLYLFLVNNGKTVASLSISILVGVFCLFQIIEQQQINSDWYEAGEKTRRFVIAMDRVYQNNWGDKPLELHFVNVPIRNGEAWVFPVGIPDALWLIYRNPSLRVFMWPTLAQAFDAVAVGSNTQKVFQFADNGEVIEMEKPLIVQ